LDVADDVVLLLERVVADGRCPWDDEIVLAGREVESAQASAPLAELLEEP
jgi:hypothetical protein